jgi:hypothetical protein
MKPALNQGARRELRGARGGSALRSTPEHRAARVEHVEQQALPAECYARVKAELGALRVAELLRVNLDISAAVAIVLRALPDLKALRERIGRELPTFDLGALDRLEDYALALLYTDTCYWSVGGPPDDLKPLVAEAGLLRERLLADATALSNHGLIESAPLLQLKGRNGYQNLGHDLQTLSQVLTQNWAKIRGKSAVARADLKAAERLATRLLGTMGARKEEHVWVDDAALERRRAFTLLIRAYADVQRAVHFLCDREGNAAALVPTLYPGRRKHRPRPKPKSKRPPTEPGAES